MERIYITTGLDSGISVYVKDGRFFRIEETSSDYGWTVEELEPQRLDEDEAARIEKGMYFADRG